MPGARIGGNAAPAGQAARSLLIVARGQAELYRALLHAFGASPELCILLDRRCASRRGQAQAVPDDRRQRERRSLPHLAEDLRLRQYILARPSARRPKDWRLTPDR